MKEKVVPDAFGCGWKPVESEPGFFTVKRQPEIPVTSDFSEHAEVSRARWDLVEYIKVRIKQLLGR